MGESETGGAPSQPLVRHPFSVRVTASKPSKCIGLDALRVNLDGSDALYPPLLSSQLGSLNGIPTFWVHTES